MLNLIFLASLIAVLPLSYGAVCPLDDGIICNNETEHKCLCVKPETTFNPYRIANWFLRDEKYCSEIVNATDPEFEAVSITFKIDEEDEEQEFDEEDFRKKIIKSLKINDDQLIILQLDCSDENDNLTVSFVILKDDDELKKLGRKVDSDDDSDEEEVALPNPRQKAGMKTVKIEKDDDDDEDDDEKTHKSGKHGKDDEDDDDHKKHGHSHDEDEDEDEKDKDGDDEEDDAEFVPYETEYLQDTQRMASDLRKKHKVGTTIADLHLSSINTTSDIEDFEPSFADKIIFVSMIALGVGAILISLLGCYISYKKCRKHRGYSDTLQRA